MESVKEARLFEGISALSEEIYQCQLALKALEHQQPGIMDGILCPPGERKGLPDRIGGYFATVGLVSRRLDDLTAKAIELADSALKADTGRN